MVRFLRKRFANAKLQYKFVMALVLVMLMLGISSIGGMVYVMNSNRELLYGSIAKYMAVIEQNVDRALTAFEQTSTTIRTDNIVQRDLAAMLALSDTQAGNPITYKLLYQNIYNRIYASRVNTPYLHNIIIYQGENSIATTNRYPMLLPEPFLSQVLDSAEKARGGVCWLIGPEESPGMYLVRTIRKIEGFTLETLGTLVMRIDMEGIIQAEAGEQLRAYDQVGLAILSGDEFIHQPQTIQGLDSVMLSKIKDGHTVARMNDEEYFMVVNRLPSSGWQYICMVPYASVLYSFLVAYRLFLGILLLTGILAVLCVNQFVRAITVHFDALIGKIQAFRGNVQPVTHSYNYSERYDEIGILHTQFDTMASEIQTLIHDNYIKQLLIREAEIKQLELQINPHFIYNTLESINWQAKAVQAEEISRMVESLGKLLRGSLSLKSGHVPLQAEIEMVDNYLTIQQIRYRKRLRYVAKVDPELRTLKVPKMILQPLVENAIRYALEEIADRCTIRLSVQIFNGVAQILVENDGSAFPENLLEALRDAQIQPHGFGIGLLNIDQRLRMTFGEAYGLSLYNKENWAAARIMIPLLGNKTKGDDENADTTL